MSHSIRTTGGAAALLASAALLPGGASAAGAFDTGLAFDPAGHETMTVRLDGEDLEVRRYEIVYVGKPVAMAAVQPSRGIPPSGAPDTGKGRPLADPLSMQKMIVYVPETAYESAEAAIILHVDNGGWFASPVRERLEPGADHASARDDDPFGRALAEGYVIVSAGTRSRSALAEDGSYRGKAPAPVVDAKAAIRYLRLNDAAMPGSAERIVITGTSGGGALSAAVAASGNSPDYYPLLAEIGAAGIDAEGGSTLADDVFATIAYCPITDLGHADAAYEWQFNAVREEGNTIQGAYPEAARTASATLAASYGPYLERLGLLLPDGRRLNGETMRDAIGAAIVAETEEVLAEGGEVPAIGADFTLVGNDGTTTTLPNDWLSVEDGPVEDGAVSVDYDAFLRFVASATPLKIVPAFDATANTGNAGLRGENSLFGGADVPYANFTRHGWDGNEVAGDGSGPDDTGMIWDEMIASDMHVSDMNVLGGAPIPEQIRMLNPLAYLGTEADSAPHWYIRHGMVDRDTAFAVGIALHHAVMADPSVEDVNFELAWLRPHSGNYDVREAYDWLAKRLENRAVETPTGGADE